MAKDAVFTMKLEPELRDAFMAEAAAEDVPASQIVREFIRGYVKSQRDKREYDEFVHRKVELARKDIEAGRTHPNDQVRAHFAERRARWLAEAGGPTE